jgi:5-methylcytosine-specific restriction enzyme A
MANEEKQVEQLSKLKPSRKELVFDLAEEAGLDMTDWVNSSNDPRGPKANPKYCYEWTFVERGKLIILNLWHSKMLVEDDRIIERGNFRADAEFHRTVTRKSTWTRRAQRIDDSLKTALRDNLPVRVIINDGKMRKRETPDAEASRVIARELDSVPWTIVDYNWETGAHVLARGIFAKNYVDQFDMDQATKSLPERHEVTISSFVRNPAIRRRVLQRSRGCCEFCGKAGFQMENGALYLETHHIVSLADGGSDEVENVVALCADDHRRAHYAKDRTEIAEKLIHVARKVHFVR